MIKFQAAYRITVYSNQETIIIGAHEETDENGNKILVQEPARLSCQFNITRSTMSDSNKATIQIKNLAPSTRERIFQDCFTLDPMKWKYVHLEAGYGDKLSMIFKGRILQAYSYKSGGQTDVITEIQAQNLDIFDTQSSHTFEAGTTFKEAAQRLAADFPNVTLANCGELEGTFKTRTTFDGNTLEQLDKLTGGHSYIDNGMLNILMNNEVLDIPVPVITDENGLLETPRRRDANLDVKMLFEPTLVVGQLLEIKSKVAPNFNGQYKVLGFTHDCLISASEAGTRTTMVNLWIGPLLPGANINLTEGTTGAAPPVSNFNKVKGTKTIPVNAKLPQNIRDVYNYIQKNGKAPHTKITNNIWWDDVVKYPSLNYEKPTITHLTNLAYCASRIQTFKDKYYPSAKIQLNSGWRSREYNRTLKNADQNSEHLYGNAIDFALIGYNINTVYNTFIKYWRGRKYLHKAWGFIHADTTLRRGEYANDW